MASGDRRARTTGREGFPKLPCPCRGCGGGLLVGTGGADGQGGRRECTAGASAGRVWSWVHGMTFPVASSLCPGASPSLTLASRCPTGTGNSIVVVTSSGLLCQELKISENFKETSTSFLSFQLLPEVRVPAAPSVPAPRSRAPPAATP